jgi:Asp-tRNA(Asn)/Glu-tRNA(Gln) amidotransferase A subunit family amidase
MSGVVGFKPTAGLVPHPIGFQAPVFGNEAVSQMARTVADAAALLDAVAGFDPRDPMTPPQLRPPAASAALEEPLAACGSPTARASASTSPWNRTWRRRWGARRRRSPPPARSSNGVTPTGREARARRG